MKKILLFTCMLFMSGGIFAQSGSISGKISDADTYEALPGANVVIKGTSKGTTTDIDGKFTLGELAPGSYALEISFIGYELKELIAAVKSGQTTQLGEIRIGAASIGLREVEIIASVAVERETPVAVSTIKAEFIENKLGTQEFPEILKSTPGVYATKTGGGFGDGRINVRGFESQNVAVMINGVPVNDMENGTVYWSNWAGLSDVAGSVQVQRGLGASKVAVPSIGGTINIVSKASDNKAGGSIYTRMGNNGYNEIGLQVNTGLSDKGWAMTLQGSRKQGAMYMDGSEFLGYSYYLNIAKQLNTQHLLTFSVIGAKQNHGQRQNKMLIERFRNSPNGIRQNDDWGKLGGEVVHVENNFYHKPQIALNHYWTINETMELSTAVYASFGTGGGGGQGGESGLFSQRVGGTYGYIDLDNIVEVNEAAAVNGEGAVSWLRASRNDHKWLGLLSVLNKEIGSKWKLTGGLDLRYYRGSHFYEITDLLGAEYVVDNSDDNNPNRVIGVGDKYNYYNDGIVGWTGLFGQAEYKYERLSAFASATVSNTSYQREDFYQYAPGDQLSDKNNFVGYSVKGGANFNLNDHHNVFANLGYFERAPFMNAVFSHYDNEANEDAVNEKVLSFEIGYGIRYSKGYININGYSTQWKDKSFTKRLLSTDGDEYYANILGVNALHSGVEVELSYEPLPNLRINGMASIADWKWQNNLTNVNITDGGTVIGTVDLYLKGIKVGDAAQTTAAVGVDYELFDNFKLTGDYNYYANVYAYFNPLNRQDESGEGVQPWKLPDYGLFDFGVIYNFPVIGFDATIYGRMNNAFDTEYISDATDGGDAASSYVFYGFGRTWSLGLKLRF
jgi:hypothetical protein